MCLNAREIGPQHVARSHQKSTLGPAVSCDANRMGWLLSFFVSDLATDTKTVISEKLNILLESIHKGKGLMGSLVNDEELSNEFKITLKELNTLIKDIKEHPKKYFRFSVF